MFLDLITNASLLITLAALYGLMARFRRIGAVRDRILAGLLFGTFAVVAMQVPFIYEQGVIYDGRSIVLTLAGLFGGTTTAALSIVIAGTDRALLGGIGVWAGLATILACALVGLFFRRICGEHPEELGLLKLYVVGLTTHVVMLICQLLLPWSVASQVITHIWLPVMLIFPVGTMIAGKLIGIEERRIATTKELVRSRARYVTTFDLSPDAITTSTLDGVLVDVNEGFTRLSGYTRQQAIGRSVLELGLWGDLEARDRMVRKLNQEGQVLNMEAAFRVSDGSIRTALISACFLDDGDAKRILTFTRDITDRAQLESQLRQSQRMETVGILAGGIAHDFNNLLTVILGYVELIRSKMDDSHPLDGPMRAIQRAARRAEDITRQLLMFSRKQTLKPVAMDLNRTIRDLQAMITRLIGADIEVIMRLSEDLWAIKADPGQVEQVIMNLAVNARDAMPEGGRLTIGTTMVEIGDHETRQQGGPYPGPHVLLTVADTGAGMDPETMERMFDPFFTTKGPDRGTGLGLATVHSIVSQSGGTIECESEPGTGTTFRILLPCTDEVEQEDRTGEQSRSPRQGGGHLLVVEDEEGVRELLVEMLESLGYEVTAATDGDKALAFVSEEGLRPDLVITDVVMPGMGGIELVARLRERIPDLRYLLMSGYAERVEQAGVAITSGDRFIQKPFGSAQDLATRVEEALRSDRPE